MGAIRQRIEGPGAIIDLVDRIEGEFWPEMPDRIIYEVAGAGSKEAAQGLMQRYLNQQAESTRQIYWMLVFSATALGAIGGNMAGMVADSYLHNHWDLALTLLGGIGTFFYSLLRPPRRIDIVLRLQQAFEENRSYTVLGRPAEEEETPFKMLPSGNKA